MATYDLGDGVPLEHDVTVNGVLTNATVTLTLTRPDGTVFPPPAISNPSVGIYRALPVPDMVGSWVGAWTTTGAAISVRPFGFAVADPAPQPYCSLASLKHYLDIDPDDTKDDDELADALASVTQEIDDVCERTFQRARTVSTRTFEPASSGVVFLDDFYSLTDLVITVDGTTWTVDQYELWPANGLLRGQPWPYNRLTARTGNTLPTGYRSVAVTTRCWGWADVPAPVHEACTIASADTFGLRTARFGVAGWGQYGDIRVRDNPMVMAKIRRYMRNPHKVA